MKRRRLLFGSLGAIALLLSAYAFIGAAMSGDFYTSSGQAHFLTAARIWMLVMLVSFAGGIGLAIAAWRAGRS
jgi:hypothetical protein